MSEILAYMQASIKNYVDGVTDVDAFREEFAGAYLYVRNRGPKERDANSLASLVIGPVAEFSGGYRSEQSLRWEIANAIRRLGVESKPSRKKRAIPYAGPSVQDFSLKAEVPRRDQWASARPLQLPELRVHG